MRQHGAKLGTGVRLAAVGWGGPRSVQVRQALAEGFACTFPGLTAEYAERDTATYWDKLQADLAADTTPDVFFMNPYFFKLYALQKAYLNLTPLARRDRVDLTDFYPVARRLYVHRGEQYGLPLHFNGINLLFHRACSTPPACGPPPRTSRARCGASTSTWTPAGA
jgi:ABC-type glycerol-3-phosphate transport system substrate-binding protein